MNRREEEQLDAAIDIAARAMLDVEPASGLRARVLAQLAPPPDSGFPRVPRPRRRLWVWTVAPAAVAAVLMVMLWPRSVPEPMHHGSDYPLPIEKPAAKPRRLPLGPLRRRTPTNRASQAAPEPWRPASRRRWRMPQVLIRWPRRRRLC